MQFTSRMGDLTQSMLSSLSGSSQFYGLKLYFLMKMLRYFSYQQSVEVLLAVTDKVLSD